MWTKQEAREREVRHFKRGVLIIVLAIVGGKQAFDDRRPGPKLVADNPYPSFSPDGWVFKLTPPWESQPENYGPAEYPVP